MCAQFAEWSVYAFLYLGFGAGVGNALACQAYDGDFFLPPTRIGRTIAFAVGMLFWPVVLLVGTIMLVRFVNEQGPY